ncbi:hypothetical protein EsH8_V_001159 [Colletotrichum jinshuiense]
MRLSSLLALHALVGSQLPRTASSHHGHLDATHHSFAERAAPVSNSTASGPVSENVDDARALLAKAHAAMSVANSAIIANPRTNRLEVLNATELQYARDPPPSLDYNSIGISTSNSLLALRGQLNNTASNATGGEPPRYSVPKEIIVAARLVSEAWTPPVDDGSHADAVAALKRKHGPAANDTQMMPPMLRHPSGLVGYTDQPAAAYRYGNISTADHEDIVSNATPTKHAAEDWWMARIHQRGSSPFAPAGYKVWRNVKDYGAKGDGVADDTEAINLAISSGGRCDSQCTGSTIYPATVYFPPGTYKVSSPIIQYHNTEMIGNPCELPVILAAPSFVGLGVITSNVYTGEISQWYANENNVLRSIRNFVVDIRATYQDAYVCGIHWQAAKGTSLENIHFYMTKPSENAATTQQGIYVENSSGGLLADLFFIGGNIGAYIGNQQFTASGLYFHEARTAVQLHWNWGGTMQGLLIDSCETGINIVGGAGGPTSTGQDVGSLLVTDLQMFGGQIGISTSLHAENSTALLLMNSVFHAVSMIVVDVGNGEDTPAILLAGAASKKHVNSWGFGRVSSPKGDVNFLNGAELATATRSTPLTRPNRDDFFTRRRPKYNNLGFAQIMDAREYGARGDGESDDTAILNYLFSAAANMSSIVYIPFGVYIITDTVEIPVGSRVIGQAWAQIMATGSRFQNVAKPYVAVRVGRPGQVGVVEIQGLVITVRGPTAGTVMMEWNVHESTQGSAGLWDTHFRVGGALGSELTVDKCPRLSDHRINPDCVAASLMLHLTSTSSAYLENVWMWAADHDFDSINQTLIDIYVGRGLLIESQGPTWLWGTSVEHCVLYQYQLSDARNVVMGFIQTESPFFQSVSKAPAPFLPGAFPSDPTFQDCPDSSNACAVSWAVRFVDSSAVHVLSASLYSFISKQGQTCIDSDRHDCQDKLFYAEESSDVWVYNLVTLGSIEMISPLNGVATLGRPNRNGFASSILAWLGGSEDVTGKRRFEGYRIHDLDALGLYNFPASCSNALTALVLCDDVTAEWTTAEYHGILPDETSTTSVCDKGCAIAIENWLTAVDIFCDGYEWEGGAAPNVLGSFIEYGLRETCQKDSEMEENCNDVILAFSDTDQLEGMPDSELCSDCHLGRLKMMQDSPYSIYASFPYYQNAMKRAVDRCSLGSQDVAPKDSPFPVEEQGPVFCLSDREHRSVDGETCDSIAKQHSVASASLLAANPQILDCSAVEAGLTLCLPLTCKTYELKKGDNCIDVEVATGLNEDALRQLNGWIKYGCENLQDGAISLGRVLCTTVPGGVYESNANVPAKATDPAYNQFADEITAPPSGAVLDDGTIRHCGRWHKAIEGQVCAEILVQHHISLILFTRVNPSVSLESCSDDLVPGLTYCVGPVDGYDNDIIFGLYEHKHFGCYARKAGGDTDVLKLKSRSSDEMTVAMCKRFCLARSYGVFGLENGNTCLCGARISLGSKRLADDRCDKKCAGKASDACGGDGAVEVYSMEATLAVEASEIGCFVQKRGEAVLTDGSFPFVLAYNDMSIQKCGSLCAEDPRSRFFGITAGNTCTCGFSMADAEQVNMAECSTLCPAGDGLTCGAAERIQVYTTVSGAASKPSLYQGVPFFHHGCYTSKGMRAMGLSHWYSYKWDGLGMTVEYCAKFCLETQGKPLFGVAGGNMCRCGAVIVVGVVPGPADACSETCVGDASQKCGGSNSINLYSISANSPTAYRRLGCARRRENGAVFAGAWETETWRDGDMTVMACAMRCAAAFPGQERLLRFALEEGSVCTCAVGGKIDHGSPAWCNTPCAGRNGEYCGGEGVADVYRMGV